MKWLNDPRIRSLVAGIVGGGIGWGLAEVLVGRPETFSDVLLVGALVGLAIGGGLGIAEGIAIGSWRQAQRGVLLGLGIGLVGGGIGASLGQLGYAATSTTSGGESTGGSSTIFSSELQQRLQQAGARSGEIEVGMSWENRNDLDLWVVEPSGERTFYKHRRSSTGGELDVDRNAACGSNSTAKPVEHIVWDRNAPTGEFKVYVHYYMQCGDTNSTDFHVEIKVADVSVGSFDGSVRSGEPATLVTAFKNAGNSANPGSEPTVSAGPGTGWLMQVLGWVIFGALLGSAEGLIRKSLQAWRNASIGGAIGGGAGGILFVLLVRALQQQAGSADVFARLVGFLVLGGCIGLLIVIVEQAFSAVVAVASGRYEGRQIFLDRQMMRIGRNDMLEVYLGGDPAMGQHHATIRREGTGHTIVAEPGMSVVVNNNAVERHGLQAGDTILLGQTRLKYSHRSSGEPVAAGFQAPIRQAPPPPGSKQAESGISTAEDTTVSSGEIPSPPPPPPPAVRTTTSTSPAPDGGRESSQLIPPPPPPPPPPKP